MLYPPPESKRRWAGVSYHHEWVGTAKHIRFTSDRTCHLWAAISRDYPYSRDRIVRWRGLPRRHGIDVVWHTEYTVEQEEVGDTLVHTFIIRGWHYCLQRYWYFFGDIEGLRSPSNTGIMGQHFTEPGPIPGPQPMLEPVCWDVMNRRIRTGNRYTFWANDTWYAVVPSLTSVQVWKFVSAGMVRQDAAGEPLPPYGAFQDGDARMNVAGDTLHISAFEAVSAPGPHLLHYLTFDLTTDTWALHEVICQPTQTAWIAHQTSLSLDAADVPHVIYTDYSNFWPEFHYRNRIGDVWSAPEPAINRANKAHRHPSAWHDATDDSFHCMAGSSAAWQYLNRRSALGVWDGLSFSLEAGINLPMHSLMADSGEAAFATIGADWRVNYTEGVPPYVQDGNLSDPTSLYANVILRPNPPNHIQIMFQNASANLAYVWRTPGGVWHPEVDLAITIGANLAAHYAHPDVISMLWQGGGAAGLCLYAIYTAWL